ncbi:MAG TPA: PilZ domain-containing protein [Polyangia bacterium]|nr:PilZ domain-containing protein [Polyangia bacterium]
MNAEHRQHPRHRSSLMIWLSSPERSLYVRLHDLSLGGLGLRVPTCLVRGQAIEIALTLPDGAEIGGRAVVAWVRPEGAPGAGLRLLETTDPLRWQLALARPPLQF